MTHNLKYLSQSKCEFRDERCYITRRRAYLLLLKDLKELKKSNFKGITAFPVSEDFMEWEAEIEGLQDTIWHGLFFQLMIHFTWAYNFVPPVVRFITIPFHPNVDQHTGQPCIEFLDNPNKWSTNYTLSSILLNLQVMLSNPVVENPVNLEAAELLIKDENLYKTVVLRLFQQPLQLKDDSSELPKDQHTFTRSIKAIPFNDYYKTWFGIATSKATEYHRAPLLKDPNFMRSYNKWKRIDLKYPKEWSLKFAASVSRLNRESNRPQKAKQQEETFYLCPTPDQTSLESPAETDFVTKIDTTEESSKHQTSPECEDFDSSWEEEVDNLVAWVNNLDTNILED
ncbi:ubiquitin-conjugating enzyme E2 U isoform X1 [Dasypus novemcinctus]|uniref:ubiquitin-conjugating enzyme E2 U isoform X1 n=1 Tax=Dasypus novemcinctus TaxID=9361 RepID=UPI00265DBD38|nr:ubiquitin-conjugating enzyme E2 U isoform X1 [Dasypus novemcinctus]